MKPPIIIGNTKSYITSINKFYDLQDEIWQKLNKDNYKYFLALPYTYIDQVAKENYNAITVGAQNFDLVEPMGETGLINFDNVRDTEAKFVIIGHSEVRKRGETNETINTKLRAVVRTRMTCVMCLGEDERDPEGKYLDEIKKMLVECLDRVVGRECEKIVLAYEPVWAIGGSVSASILEAQEVIIFIRRVLIDLFGISDAKKIKVLYGGSVDGNNASLYTKESGADGLLVGRGCMDADVFAEIINSVNK